VLLHLAAGVLEDGLVAFVLLHHGLDRLMQLLQQLRVHVLLAQPGGAGLGHGVEQVARRMLRAQEEVAVAQGGLHHRHLQPHQHVGGGRIVLHLAFDFVVEQVQQFEGVRIRTGQRGIGSVA